MTAGTRCRSGVVTAMIDRRDAGVIGSATTSPWCTRAQDEVGDQRDAQALGDQAHDGDVVLGLVRHVGAEAGVVGQLQEVPATPRDSRRSTAPRRGRPGRRSPAVDTAWPSRHGQAHLVVEQRCDDELVEVLLAAPEVGALVGERHREVALAGLERGQALRRLGLGEA